MRQSMRLGRIGGIPIGVHWSVFVIMLLLVQGLAMAILPAGARGYAWMVYWGVAVLVAALFLAALLAHELRRSSPPLATPAASRRPRWSGSRP
jgi:Zn-dependent protease